MTESLIEFLDIEYLLHPKIRLNEGLQRKELKKIKAKLQEIINEIELKYGNHRVRNNYDGEKTVSDILELLKGKE